MPAVIGTVQQRDLAIYQGSDLNFDVKWYGADQTTPISMASANAAVRDQLGGQLLLDLTDYITIDGNTASLSVPADVTADLVPTSRAYWDIDAVALDSGETKKVMRGRVRIYAEASPEESS